MEGAVNEEHPNIVDGPSIKAGWKTLSASWCEEPPYPFCCDEICAFKSPDGTIYGVDGYEEGGDGQTERPIYCCSVVPDGDWHHKRIVELETKDWNLVDEWIRSRVPADLLYPRKAR